MRTASRVRLVEDEDGVESYVLPADHRLPGWTVDALLADGKVEEARAELERLIMEGVDSGPGIPVTETFWDDLRAELHREAGLSGE